MCSADDGQSQRHLAVSIALTVTWRNTKCRKIGRQIAVTRDPRSAGLVAMITLAGVLVQAYVTTKNKGGTLKLVNVRCG